MGKSELNCTLCALPKLLNAIPVGKFWTLNVAENAKTRPWLVLQSNRHVSSMSNLESDESIELGLISRLIIQHLESLPSIHRAHIYYLNETIPSHVHLHFSVSTFANKRNLTPWVLNMPWPETLEIIDKELWLPKIEYTVSEKKEPSILVRGFVRLAHKIQSMNVIYPFITRRLVNGNKDQSLAAEILVSASLTFLILGFYLSSINLYAAAFFSIVGLLRIVDIWSTQIAILIDRQAKQLKSFERTLVLAVINCAELAVISGIWAICFFSLTPLNAFNFGFHIATNRSEIISPESLIGTSIDVIGTATSLLLLVAVVAMALGRLTSDRFEETLD